MTGKQVLTCSPCGPGGPTSPLSPLGPWGKGWMRPPAGRHRSYCTHRPLRRLGPRLAGAVGEAGRLRPLGVTQGTLRCSLLRASSRRQLNRQHRDHRALGGPSARAVPKASLRPRHPTSAGWGYTCLRSRRALRSRFTVLPSRTLKTEVRAAMGWR